MTTNRKRIEVRLLAALRRQRSGSVRSVVANIAKMICETWSFTQQFEKVDEK